MLNFLRIFTLYYFETIFVKSSMRKDCERLYRSPFSFRILIFCLANLNTTSFMASDSTISPAFDILIKFFRLKRFRRTFSHSAMRVGRKYLSDKLRSSIARFSSIIRLGSLELRKISHLWYQS